MFMTTSKSTATKKINSGHGEKAKKTIKVYLANQILEAYDGSERVFRFECVTGDADHPTIPGKFIIDRQYKTYRSHQYKVQMNYAMFFSHGKAIHQYHGFLPLPLVRASKSVTDLVGSHGCVRLSEADARALFDWTPRFTEVHVL